MSAGNGGKILTKKFTVYATLSKIEADSVEDAWKIFEEWYVDTMLESTTTSCGDLFDIVEESK